MCQGCYGSWSFVNEQCPLASDLAMLFLAHQSRADLAYQMRFGLMGLGFQTTTSPPRTIKTKSKTFTEKEMLKKSTSTCPCVSSKHRNQDRAKQQERIFQKPPIIWCVGAYNEIGHRPKGILYRTNKTFDRTGQPFKAFHWKMQLIISHKSIRPF